MSEVKYQIKIKTQDAYADGSTNATVMIQLVGECGNATEWMTLDNFWRNDFARGRTDNFTVTGKDVGSILMIRFKLHHSWLDKDDIWACENVAIQSNSGTYEFPVFDYVNDQIEVLRGDAQIPQRVGAEIAREQRRKEIRDKKSKFVWIDKAKPGDKAWMMPRIIGTDNYETLNSFLKNEDVRKNYLDEMQSIVKLNIIIEVIKSKIFAIHSFDDYKHLFFHWKIPGEMPAFIEKWQDDEEMGRQMLNGVNPIVIVRCTKLPENCKIKNGHVEGLLNCGKTLEDEMANGRIYIIDHSKKTAGVSRNSQLNSDELLHSPNSMALFYSPGDGRLLPIAIQLVPDNAESIFTPKDENYDWLLAKMYFRTNDAVVHEWISHFLYTHTAMEPIAIALIRCLPRSHPVYKLLYPHLKTVVATNQIARDQIIYPNSPSNYGVAITGSEQIRKAFESFNFSDLEIPKKLSRNDVLDSELLQNFNYRDDSLLLWDVVSEYVSDVIKFYYKQDKDVSDDSELQDWIKEVAFDGFGWLDNNTRGCPTSFSSVDDLISFGVIVVFTSSVQHAAINFAQFDFYKFIPNCPMGMRLPIHKRGEGTLERVLDSLPDVTMATIQLGTTYLLSSFAPKEIFLGEFPLRLFTEPEVDAILVQFAKNLKKAGDKIRERNKKILYPYEYLLPEKIPSSIAI